MAADDGGNGVVKVTAEQLGLNVGCVRSVWNAAKPWLAASCHAAEPLCIHRFAVYMLAFGVVAAALGVAALLCQSSARGG
jgi:hypothetical protein